MINKNNAIYNKLKAEIYDFIFKKGTDFQNFKQICDEFGINHYHAKNILRDLEDENKIEIRSYGKVFLIIPKEKKQNTQLL